MLRSVTSEWLRRNRHVFVVAAFVLAAALAPLDAVAQLQVALPLLLIYELAARVLGLTEAAERDPPR